MRPKKFGRKEVAPTLGMMVRSYNMAVNLVRQSGRERAGDLLELSFAQRSWRWRAMMGE